MEDMQPEQETHNVPGLPGGGPSPANRLGLGPAVRGRSALEGLPPASFGIEASTTSPQGSAPKKKPVDWEEVSTKGVPRVLLPRGTRVRLCKPGEGWWEEEAGKPGWQHVEWNEEFDTEFFEQNPGTATETATETASASGAATAPDTANPPYFRPGRTASAPDTATAAGAATAPDTATAAGAATASA